MDEIQEHHRDKKQKKKTKKDDENVKLKSSKKKEKKAKKKKKRKTTDSKESDQQPQGSYHVSSSNNAISVPLNSTIVSSLDGNNTSSSMSWGSVFAAAEKLPQISLDDDFLQRTSSGKNTHSSIAQIAKEYHQSKSISTHDDVSSKPTAESKLLHNIHDKQEQEISSKKRKRQEEGEDDDVEIHPVQKAALEGRMVSLPNSDEMMMVLLDRKTKHVFSALDDSLNEGKDRNVIGKLQKDDTIQFYPQFLKQKECNTNNESEKTSPIFPYPTDPDDHCETPQVAYQDILPLLHKVAKLCKVSPSNLSIYDPYYCNGTVIKNLNSLGFPQVYNKKENCYDIWSSGNIPKFHTFLTNPPYSEDHIPKLMDFLTKDPSMDQKPWFLLMPTWVHKKDYFIKSLKQKSIQPFYLIPKKRYVYTPPKNFREKKESDVHKKSSPFVSMWYVWGGSSKMNDTLIRSHSLDSCDLARSKSALRDLRRKGKNKT